MSIELPPGFGLLLLVTLIFWAFGIHRHRTPHRRNRIRIESHIARFLGSHNSYVDLNTLSTQVGIASILLWYTVLTWLDIPRSLGVSAVLSMLTILGVQWTAKAKDTHQSLDE